MKNKILMSVLTLLTLLTIIAFWVKQLTKLPNFDIFGSIDDDETEEF